MGTCQSIEAADADMLGYASAYLDHALRVAVDAARSKLQRAKIIYESLRDLCRGHELCSKPPPGTSHNDIYLNGVLPAGNLDSPAPPDVSFHPNRVGHQKTADQVAVDVKAQLAPAPVAAGPTGTFTTHADTPGVTTASTPPTVPTEHPPTTTSTPPATTSPPTTVVVTVNPSQWINVSDWDAAGPAVQNGSGICGRNSGRTDYRITLPKINPGERVVVRARLSSADPGLGTTAWLDRVTPYVANGFPVDVGPDDGVGATYQVWDSFFNGDWFLEGPNLTEFNTK